jgi:hypothetical protein
MDIQRIGVGNSRFPSINEGVVDPNDMLFTFDSTEITFDSNIKTFDEQLVAPGTGDYSKLDYNNNDYLTETI